MGTAELIAAAHGYQKISVIAGVGSQLIWLPLNPKLFEHPRCAQLLPEAGLPPATLSKRQRPVLFATAICGRSCIETAFLVSSGQDAP